MANVRPCNVRYKGKADMGNNRMRWLRYFLVWVNEQAVRLNITPESIITLLRHGATFEDVEAAKPTPPEPTAA